MLHELLAEAADWPRVVQCAQTVPVLLYIYFNTVITVKNGNFYKSITTVNEISENSVMYMFVFQVADEKLLAHLILVMLERSAVLLNIPTYSKEIHRCCCCLKVTLCSSATSDHMGEASHKTLVCMCAIRHKNVHL